MNTKYAIDSIRDYCDHVRNDVQLASEISIQNIIKYREDLFKNIKEYEKNCIEHLGKNFKSYNDLNLLIIRSNSFHLSQISYLKNYKINDQEIEKNYSIAEELISKLDTEHALFKAHQFNGIQLKFEDNSSNIKEATLGSIYYEKLLNEFPNLDKLKKIDLKNSLNSFIYSGDYPLNSKMEIQRLENENFLILYSYKLSSPSLIIINSQGKIINQTSDYLSYCFDFKMSINKNLIFVYYNNQNQSKIVYCNGIFNNLTGNSSNSNNNLRAYDENLKLIKQASISNDCTSLSANNFNLFCLNKKELSILVLDHGLNVLKSVCINFDKPDKPYYLSNLLCSKMKVDNHNFYFWDDFNLTIINISNGKRMARFRIVGKDFVLYQNTIVCILDGSNEIYYYSLDGSVIKKQKKLEFMLLNINLIDNNDKITFYDPNNRTIYA